jgi:hypothetical protein
MAICLTGTNNGALLILIFILLLALVIYLLHRQAFSFAFDEDARNRMLESWRKRRKGR